MFNSKNCGSGGIYGFGDEGESGRRKESNESLDGESLVVNIYDYDYEPPFPCHVKYLSLNF